MDLQNIELPPDLEIMRAQALKRYKLRVFLQKVDEWTIMAHDEEEAKELVLNKGQGRPAGGIEPRIVKMEIEEMGEGDPSNALLVEKVQVDGDANVKPLIEVVRG